MKSSVLITNNTSRKICIHSECYGKTGDYSADNYLGDDLVKNA